MAGFDDLLAEIPTQDIAAQLGADQGEVDAAIQTLIPVLVSGLQHNAEDPDHAGRIEAAARGADQGERADGHQAIATIFGGNDADQVATALSGAGAGDSELMKKLMPILVPIVLAYIGKQLVGKRSSTDKGEQSDGGLGDVLGSILGGAASGNKSPGSILGDLLGGKLGGAIGDVLGGLLGNKK